MQFKAGNNFTPEELVALKDLGKMLGFTVVKSLQQTLTPVDYKVVKCVTTCVLCKTVTVQYLKLCKYSNGVWLKEKDLSFEETVEIPLNKFELYVAKVKSCWACKAFLLLKTREELVEMYMKLYAPVMSSYDIGKQAEKFKKEHEEKEMKLREQLR
jgi:hypothetical protein